MAVQVHTEPRVFGTSRFLFCLWIIHFILSNTMNYLFQIIATPFVSNFYFGLFETSKHLPIELRHSLILPTAGTTPNNWIPCMYVSRTS